MRIVFLVERPTQFEAPFYRFAAADPAHQLRVLFTGAAPGAPVFDPELGRPVEWGIDLLGEYPHAVAPAAGRGRWLAGELRRGGCDLLIVNGYTRRDYLEAAWRARRAGIATALRLDSVLWKRGAAPPRGRRLLFGAALRRLFDLFLGVGSLTLDYLDACGVPAERRGLFPYAVDVAHFRAAAAAAAGGAATAGAGREAARRRLGVPPGARVVLAVAKLNRREAPWDAVAALPRMAPDTWLVIAGDGEERAELERRSAAGRVRFLGYVAYAELPALYAAADLFVHAPREERWGVSVAEAMACGLPVVVSSRVGAGVDLVEAGANGWTYEAGDAAALARRAGDALALDRTAVEAANRAVLARWDYAASWRHLLDAGQRIVGGSAR